MKTVYENEYIKVSETSQNYDFVAVIQNKTDTNIVMQLDEDIANENAIEPSFEISANGWIGLFNMQYDGNTKQALLQGDYNIVIG